MSNVKKSNTQTMEEVHKKNKFTQWGSHILMSILTSNMKVTKIVQKHFLCTFLGFLVTIICDIKIDNTMCEPHYVNLFFLWTSSIVHVFDFLTFDILLTTWHLFDSLTSFWQLDIFFDICTTGHMGNGTHGQRGIMANIKGRDGVPSGMGHMGDGAHGQWGTWAIGHMIITSLILHGSL